MFLENTNRKIIPRWRAFWTTVELGELDDPKPDDAILDQSEYVSSETRRAWLEHQTIWHALDFLNSGFVHGVRDDPELQRAAQFVLERQDDVPFAGRELAREIVAGESRLPSESQSIVESEEDVRKQIQIQRARLKVDPRSSVAWVDLALYYTILGLNQKAEHAIRMACRLSPENRFVLRSAARFLAHIGDHQGALSILREAGATDPWIVASEIGLSSFAKVDAEFSRVGRGLLEQADLPPFSTSELASALATVDLLNGKQKKAKKLFRDSIIDPNDNSLAQAEWATTQLGDFGLARLHIEVPRDYEARALNGLREGAWNQVLNNALKWRGDQPFSSRPAEVASYVWATILEEHEKAVDILRLSLKPNPGDPTLVNNLAFSLINLGQSDEARKLLDAIDVSGPDDIALVPLIATRGLLSFRTGEPSRGRSLYLQAISMAQRLKNAKYEAVAYLYLAREELLSNLPTKKSTLQVASRLAGKQTDPDMPIILDRVVTLSKSR